MGERCVNRALVRLQPLRYLGAKAQKQDSRFMQARPAPSPEREPYPIESANL